uniref:UDENN domain-containing protein n=1 Tax=Arcella intermedia TaxID=1963864 RepID=A0A6B2L3J6_9EUKA
MKLYGALLQEEQVCFVSKNLSVLSAVTLSFIPMFRPLIWQGIFIPILPKSLIDCIQAPVPYLIGLEEIPSTILADIQKLVYIYDIDANVLHEPQLPISIPPLPDAAELLTKINFPHIFYHFDESERRKAFSHPYRNTPTELNLAKRVVEQLIQYNTRFSNWVKTAILDTCIPPLNTVPGIDGFDLANEECVAEVTKQLHTLDEQKFSKNFLQTQMFVFYYEQYMQEEIKAEYKKNPNLISTAKPCPLRSTKKPKPPSQPQTQTQSQPHSLSQSQSQTQSQPHPQPPHKIQTNPDFNLPSKRTKIPPKKKERNERPFSDSFSRDTLSKLQLLQQSQDKLANTNNRSKPKTPPTTPVLSPGDDSIATAKKTTSQTNIQAEKSPISFPFLNKSRPAQKDTNTPQIYTTISTPTNSSVGGLKLDQRTSSPAKPFPFSLGGNNSSSSSEEEKKDKSLAKRFSKISLK